jgi:hypothetical protein
MQLHFRRRWVSVLILGCACFGASSANAQPVEQLVTKSDLENSRIKYAELMEKFRTGQQDPVKGNKEHEQGMEWQANYLILRFTLFQEPGKSQFAKYQKEFEAFSKSVESDDNKKKNREFVKQFTPFLLKAYDTLFDQKFHDYRQPIINVAPTLVWAAHMRGDGIGYYLAAILTDQKKNRHDVIKYYAAKAMREFFPVEPTEKGAILAGFQARRKDRELQMVDALTKFIERPAAANSEDEEAAYHYLRREAIESLAFAQTPTVVFDKGKVDCPIAPLLFRILSPKSDLKPAPNLAEKLEAAIGACEIKYKDIPDYQPELQPYLVGLFLHEYFIEYNKDLAEIKGDTRKPARMTWKIHSKRLELALGDMVKRAKGQAGVEKNAKLLESAAVPMLGSMQGKEYKQINQQELLTYRNSVMNYRPKTNAVFNGIKGHIIELDPPKVEADAPK